MQSFIRELKSYKYMMQQVQTVSHMRKQVRKSFNKQMESVVFLLVLIVWVEIEVILKLT